MNAKFFLAVLTASAIAFFGGWLIFGMVFNEYYSANTNEVAKALMKSPNMVAIAISNVAWALLITWVLQKTGSTNARKGFTTSLWVSFLVTVVFNVSLYAFWDVYEIPFLIIDICISSVFWGIVGSVSGAILGTERTVTVKATSRERL